MLNIHSSSGDKVHITPDSDVKREKRAENIFFYDICDSGEKRNVQGRGLGGIRVGIQVNGGNLSENCCLLLIGVGKSSPHSIFFSISNAEFLVKFDEISAKNNTRATKFDENNAMNVCQDSHICRVFFETC
jgi:hypothetical protein